MTQEDIELLATDISARIKHGVQVMLIENEEAIQRAEKSIVTMKQKSKKLWAVQRKLVKL